jgi:serine phosphatase RsbU (regulator of sigma subunit)/pSer/pThr/pTyr-binding forkhead associated (FHA) protein
MDPRTRTIRFQERLRIEAVVGPTVEPLELEPGASATIGRSMQNTLVLLDGSVSREHASIQDKGGRWLLTDLGSRHGTTLNGVPVEPGDPAPIESGDLVRIGPWTLRVRIGDSISRPGLATPGASSAFATVVTRRNRGEVVQEVDAESIGRLAQHRLELLFEYAAQINAAPDEAGLCAAALDSALAGSGYGRGAMLRAGEDGCEVISARVRGEEGERNAARFDISASLLAKAGEGRPALLESLGGGSAPQYGQSVMDLRIHSALCVPVIVGDEVSAFLYLDARGREAGVQPDATGFCVALGRLCGLAMANLVRRELEKRQTEMMAMLGAAREAQQVILPPESGVVGGLRYALRMKPGLYVAGDLFDIVEVAPGRVAVFLGDVTGEGIGAGILMASGQAHLHALLLQHGDPEQAVNEVNRYLAAHSPPDRFISLWVGVFDKQGGTMTYVDAGHGHFVFIPAGGEPRKLEGRGGIPAAIDPDVTYTARTVPFGAGDRLVVFSDGVIEQSGEGATRATNQFGFSGVLGVLSRSGSPEGDAEGLMRAVMAHAGRDALDDDTTVASVQWVVEGGTTRLEPGGSPPDA